MPRALALLVQCALFISSAETRFEQLNLQTAQFSTSVPSFDVSSIKPARAGLTKGGYRRIDEGVVMISSMTVKELISNAYDVREDQVLGGPPWVNTIRFDIDAKDTTVGANNQLRPSRQGWADAITRTYEKLRNLMHERFQLVVHSSTRDTAVYALVVADVRKLHNSTCSDSYLLATGLAKGHMHLSSLAAELARDLQRPVTTVDNSGRCFAFDLKWTQDPNNSEVPSISTALHEAGLRLESQKGSEKVYVIDHVEKPEFD